MTQKEMEPIKVNLNIVGMDELKEAIDEVYQKDGEFRKAVRRLYSALNAVGIEINQSPDRADD